MNDPVIGQARDVLNRIKDCAENLSGLINYAWRQELWKEAGYASWDDCCLAEFPGLVLTAERRLSVVGELAESGMTDRAIAVALNVDHKTVSKARLSGGDNSPPDNKAVGRDGKRYGRNYVPGTETTQRLCELNQYGVSMPAVADATGVHYQSLAKIKTGRQRTVSTVDAQAVEKFYTDTFGADHIPPPPEPVADVVPIQRKTGPQLNAARAEARHSLVNAAITLQKAARQIGLVDPRYLKFCEADRELEQAPEIISESLKSITASLKEIQHVQPTV